ncbi:hypothetical protein Ssi03_41030 [Sphaerisporangium siamense]|uniref:NIPSNAP domain-containing protein n=1 Tax=Sphaerisporangium siamense TaxID=795645 RepID=A0A7W7DCX1_9ACTN|nr:hypothetical protein [Sphaerisporangium siamense]MBB4704502.1 hypothetical protein [Sphaerisporangium siamense]GII86113.1 hypothetical protein Ssi03_41030 [Sphaerisporangium siamense]
MIYLVYRMKLGPRARRDMRGFWQWLEDRESWFYRDLPMVREVRWYYSAIGDVYVIENWAAFDDEAGWGAYRAALAGLKSDGDWETQRVSQDDWWEFLDTRIVTDLPVRVGIRRQD